MSTDYTIEQRNTRWEWVAAVIGVVSLGTAIYFQDFVGDRNTEKRIKSQIQATLDAQGEAANRVHQRECTSTESVRQLGMDMISRIYDDDCNGIPDRGELYREAEALYPVVYWVDTNIDGIRQCKEKYLDMEEDGLNGNERSFSCR